MQGYIYSIINKVNNKRYVGKTVNLDRRLQRHWIELKNNNHHSIKLQRAYNKYGKDSFKVEYEQYNVKDEEELYRLEIQTIQKYNSYYDGYNQTLGGEGNNTIFDFKTMVLLYQIGQRYKGIIHQLARYYNCDRTTISSIFNRDNLGLVSYNEKDLQQLIKKLNLKDSNLIENYKDNYSRKLTRQQVVKILAVIEIKKYSQAVCGEAFGVTKDIVSGIIRGLTYKEDKKIYDLLTLQQKEKIANKVLQETDIEKNHFKNKRANIKNTLTQQQVDYILDNINKKTQTQIAKELNISTDRVASVKKGLSYKDYISDYYKRHSESNKLPV